MLCVHLQLGPVSISVVVFVGGSQETLTIQGATGQKGGARLGRIPGRLAAIDFFDEAQRIDTDENIVSREMTWFGGNDGTTGEAPDAEILP
jgi:hypothetical protein